MNKLYFKTALEVNKVQCPLCHTNIPNGEDSWKSHLLGRDGCPQNQRRVQAGKFIMWLGIR